MSTRPSRVGSSPRGSRRARMPSGSPTRWTAACPGSIPARARWSRRSRSVGARSPCPSAQEPCGWPTRTATPSFRWTAAAACRAGASGWPASPGGVAVGFGSVWVAEPLAHKVLRIDPRSGKTQAEIGRRRRGGPGGGRSGSRLGRQQARRDPFAGSTRNVTRSRRPCRSGMRPTGVAAGAGGVWVTDEGGGELVSVDAQSGEVRRRYVVGAAPVAVALAGATPWVRRAPRRARSIAAERFASNTARSTCSTPLCPTTCTRESGRPPAMG